MAGFSEFVNSGGGGSAPKKSGGGSFADFVNSGTATSKATAPSKKAAKGFFGINLPNLPKLPKFLGGADLPDLPAIGVTTAKSNPLTQARDMVVGAGPMLARFGGDIVSEGRRQGKRQGLLDRLFRPAEGERSTVPLFDPEKRAQFREESPLSYELMTSPARTARQVPDTLAAIRPGGPGFGQSDLGKQIAEEGVMSTVLAKGGDIALLAGGAGLLAQAGTKGGGLIGQASKLERTAKMSAKAAGLPADEFTLAKAAAAADAAGDVQRAMDLARAADQLSKAGRLRDVVAQSGTGSRAAGRVAEVGGKVGRGMDRASALPFLPTQKLLGVAGKGLGAAGRAAVRSERGSALIGKAQEAVGRADTRREVGDLYHEAVRAPFEGEMHTVFERHGLEDVARTLSPEEQAAIYLSKSQEAADPAIRRLLATIDELPPEVRPDAIAELFPDGSVTAEMLELARRFEAGDLPPEQLAKLNAASEALSAVQSRREGRYVSGRGTSRQLSDEALEARRQRTEGGADVDAASVVEKRTRRTRGRLSQIAEEMDELQRAPEPDPVPPSRYQERQAARLAERTRRAELTAKAEEARGERLLGRAAKDMERLQKSQGNREGQVIGRGRERMLERDQLDTGVESRRRQAETRAKREAKLAQAAKREDTRAVRQAAADEASAEAAKLKGVPKQPTRGQVQQRIHLDAERAKIRSRAEQDTAAKALAKSVEEQRQAAARARKKLDAAQSQERSTLDRFERENIERADAKQRKRFETLQKREADALDKLAKETEEALNSVEAAAPQDRPALQVAARAKRFALEMAESHPERASEFAALADEIADTHQKMRDKGIKTEFFLGGPEMGDMPVVPRTAKLRGAKKLASERQRKSGVLARNVKAQTEKYAKEMLDTLHNEFRGTLQSKMGTTAGEAMEIKRHATGEDIAKALDDADLVAWDPETGKLLDAADIDRNSAVLPKAVWDEAKKFQARKDPNVALRVYDKVTGGWKHSVLALSPRWHIGNIVGNAALATLGAGLSPADIALNIRQARRLVKAFEEGKAVPPEHEAALGRILAAGFNNPDLAKVQNARAVGRVINKSYHFNGYVDSVNRTMVYLAKKGKGVSADAAVQMALKSAGDFSKMTPFERNVVRRIIPFYAWQRHITRLSLSLPFEHPTRVLWTLHLADMEDRLNPDPGADNEFNEGTIPFGDKRLNVRQFFPFSSSFWTDPTYRGAGYQVNPVLKLGVAAATGFNLGKMKPVSGKFRGENPSGFGAPVKALPPGALAEFVTTQFPQVGTIRDLVAGDAPVRYDTGEPRKVGKGASKKNAKPTLTGRGRKETLSRFIGIPIPEKETKPVKRK